MLSVTALLASGYALAAKGGCLAKGNYLARPFLNFDELLSSSYCFMNLKQSLHLHTLHLSSP